MMEWHTFNNKNIKSKFLFKFLSEKYLIEFIRTGNLWFSRSDKFGDKMECVTIKDLLRKPRPDFNEIEKRKKRHLISCFHEGNKETLAFWDTYARVDKERRKYALRFNREELVSIIEGKTNLKSIPKDTVALTHGKVVYKNLINSTKLELKAKTVPHVAFRKEYVFAYEKEYRFDILLKGESRLPGHNLYLGETQNIPFKILVNPLLENNEYKDCIQKIKSINQYDRYSESPLTKWLKPEMW